MLTLDDWKQNALLDVAGESRRRLQAGREIEIDA